MVNFQQFTQFFPIINVILNNLIKCLCLSIIESKINFQLNGPYCIEELILEPR